MTDRATPQQISTMRAFNRTYTQRLGLLRGRLDDSPFSLSEARLLYELAQRRQPTAAELARALDLDPAQVSRTLKRFAARHLVETHPNPAHRKQQLLALSPAGKAAFDALEANTRAAIGALLDPLPAHRRARLLRAADAIAAVLAADGPAMAQLRDLRPGDLGMVTARQAILYAEEYGWNGDYEALVAAILADFHRSFDPARDAAWIADLDGEMMGSIFLVRGEAPGVAKLRLLYVEPAARGTGIGRRLVDACIERARALGYARIDLWTNSVLVAARRIYQRAGFELIEEAPHHSFGHDLVGQTWSLDLRAAGS